jgi:hypothetical protein
VGPIGWTSHKASAKLPLRRARASPRCTMKKRGGPREGGNRPGPASRERYARALQLLQLECRAVLSPSRGPGPTVSIQPRLPFGVRADDASHFVSVVVDRGTRRGDSASIESAAARTHCVPGEAAREIHLGAPVELAGRSGRIDDAMAQVSRAVGSKAAVPARRRRSPCNADGARRPSWQRPLATLKTPVAGESAAASSVRTTSPT